MKIRLPFLLIFIISLSLSFSNASFIVLPNISAPHYSYVALTIFSIGLILFVILLFLVFGIIFLKGNFTNGLIIFVLAMISLICLLLSGSYVETSSFTSYNVISPSGNYIVNSTSVSTTPIATNQIIAILIFSVSVVDAVLALISLLTFMFFQREKKRNEKYEDWV